MWFGEGLCSFRVAPRSERVGKLVNRKDAFTSVARSFRRRHPREETQLVDFHRLLSTSAFELAFHAMAIQDEFRCRFCLQQYSDSFNNIFDWIYGCSNPYGSVVISMNDPTEGDLAFRYLREQQSIKGQH